MQGSKKNVKFSGNDSILNNTAENGSDVAELLEPIQEDSLIQQAMANDSSKQD